MTTSMSPTGPAVPAVSKQTPEPAGGFRARLYLWIGLLLVAAVELGLLLGRLDESGWGSREGRIFLFVVGISLTSFLAAYLLASYWIARSIAPGRTASIAAAVFLSQPAITSLLLGQMGGVLMLLLTACWLADRRDRPFLSGVLLGIAIAAKPFLIVCATYAVWRRSRPLAMGLAAGIAGVVAVGLAAAGAAGVRAWVDAIGQISWSAHGETRARAMDGTEQYRSLGQVGQVGG